MIKKALILSSPVIYFMYLRSLLGICVAYGRVNAFKAALLHA